MIAAVIILLSIQTVINLTIMAEVRKIIRERHAHQIPPEDDGRRTGKKLTEDEQLANMMAYTGEDQDD